MPFALIAALASLAASTPSPAPMALTRYSSLTLDPAATRIAAVESRWGKDKPSADHGAIVLRDTSGRVIDRIDPCDTCAYDGLAWSPDGKRLAYIGRAGGTATVYVLEGSKSRKVTSLSGLAASPRWSPDGSLIALLVTENARKETGATQPGVRQVGLIGTTDDSRRIAIVAATGGEYRLVSPAGTFVYEYDWFPDGQGFAATASEGNGDNQWWVASLRAYFLTGGMRVIARPTTQINFPRVAPDGKSIAYIGGLMSDFGSVGGDVYVVPMLGGGAPRNLTDGYKATFTSLQWRGQKLLVSANVAGSEAVGTIDPATAKIALGTPVAESFGAGEAHVAADRSGTRAAYVTESYEKAPAIAFGPVGQGRRITHDNDTLPVLVTTRDVRWKSSGHDVQGWLLAPAAAAGDAAKQPMVTIVHGGPAAAHTPRYIWNDVDVALLAHGYWLFMPNPRGSYGQGAAFTRANVKDFGGGDLDDILAGIDQVEKQAPIDDARLGLFGHSYGGFMTMWTVTHSQRFKAAVAGAGISDWVAYYGQNGIDQWMIPYFGASAYDDPKVYDRLSPIRYIKQVKTPVFLYVGERDVECPPAQSLEYWHGLKAMGVPTELMIYADEGHGIRSPRNIADRDTRAVGWFDKYLGR